MLTKETTIDVLSRPPLDPSPSPALDPSLSTSLWSLKLFLLERVMSSFSLLPQTNFEIPLWFQRKERLKCLPGCIYLESVTCGGLVYGQLPNFFTVKFQIQGCHFLGLYGNPHTQTTLWAWNQSAEAHKCILLVLITMYMYSNIFSLKRVNWLQLYIAHMTLFFHPLSGWPYLSCRASALIRFSAFEFAWFLGRFLRNEGING